MMASEGVISSVFYQMYKHEVFKNTFLKDDFYSQFGIDRKDIDPLVNFYLKVLFIISKINLRKPTMMTDFIRTYGEEYPDEIAGLYSLFLEVTHFSTTSKKATQIFGNLYRIGRQGEVSLFRDSLIKAREWKKNLLNEILHGKLTLSHALVEELWIDADKEITPIPWKPEIKARYHLDLNTATEIDLLAFNNMTLDHAKNVIKIRDSQGGFKSLDEFHKTLSL